MRYDITHKEATISVAVSQPFRGCGYGRQVILLGCQKIGQYSGIEKINAYVKPNNLASLKVFLKCGFQNIGETIVKDQPALHLSKNL